VVEIVMAQYSRETPNAGICQKEESAPAGIIPEKVDGDFADFYIFTHARSSGRLGPMTPPSPGLAVVTTGLTKEFGDRRVVDSLDLTIPTGSVCGFVGPNGAGKTTTIRMLLGLIRPTSGEGRILLGDLDHPSSYLSRVGALIESPAFYPALNGWDNLLVLTRLGQLPTSAIDSLLERVGLADRARDRFSRYSLGMKQRLGIAAALLADPSLLILDEPTNGLDPAGIVEMRSLIRSLADEGMTLFVSSHLLSEIEHICDHVVMIRSGRTVFQGSVAELRAMRTAELVLRPESPGQLGLLAQLISERGLEAEIEEATSSVVVAASTALAGELNRAAFQAGVTVSYLAERERSLEEAYFALTGTHSGDVEHSGALGVIR
jgi:ABC-2 type transport system ATP-binding protein